MPGNPAIPSDQLIAPRRDCDSKRVMGFFFIIVVIVLGYFWYDGYHTRPLPKEDAAKTEHWQGGIQTRGWTFWEHLDPANADVRHFFVINGKNNTDYIIRKIEVAAILSFGDEGITMSGQCEHGNDPDLRLLIGRSSEQLCAVEVPQNVSDFVERFEDYEISWRLVKVEGHHPPMRFVKSVFDWLEYHFGRVNA